MTDRAQYEKKARFIVHRLRETERLHPTLPSKALLRYVEKEFIADGVNLKMTDVDLAEYAIVCESMDNTTH